MGVGVDPHRHVVVPPKGAVLFKAAVGFVEGVFGMTAPRQRASLRMLDRIKASISARGISRGSSAAALLAEPGITTRRPRISPS